MAKNIKEVVITIIGFVALVLLCSIPMLCTSNNNPTKANTLNLQNWCGKPVGSIYQTSAVAYDAHTYEDEQGNLWSVNDDINVNGFYLLWLDDQSTEKVEDDTIVKVWQERG